MQTGLSMRLSAEATARGLDTKRLAEKFGVGTGTRAGGDDYLIIPYRRGGELKNRKYRTTLVPGSGGGKSWQDSQDKGATRMLYNEDVLRDAKLRGQPVIIAEGEPDTWAFDQCGFERVVGWPDGAPEVSIPADADSPKYKPLDDAMGQGLFRPDNLGGADVPIIVAADGDAAGAVLLHDLTVRLGKARCKFLTYPLLPPAAREARGRDRCKDIGEVLEFYGQKGVVETVNRAQWVAVPGVYRMSELPPRPEPLAFDVGMPGLDIRLRLGDWSVWTGIPSMGKTTLVNDVVNRVVEGYSWDSAPLVVVHASFEQEPQIDHRRNLAWWLNKKHPSKQSESERDYAEGWIDRHFRFLVAPEDEDISVGWTLDKLAVAVVRENAKIVVIDPWNEMDHVREPGESVTDYTGRAIKAFRRFARSMGVHLIVVAHPTKIQQKADGTFPIPTLYSVSDSAHWYNKSDLGMVIHQIRNRTVIWAQKSRYHDQIGRPEMYEAIYHHGERRYEILGKYDPDAD